MTTQDNWRPEMARLAQRRDQLERQQRDSNRNVEALQRDGDALKRDVDRRLDSLRRETGRHFRDGERRVGSLERSRDTFENLFWFSMLLAAAVAVIIVLVIAAIVSREQRREAGEPEQRSPASIDAPLAGSGGPLPPSFVAAGKPFRQPGRHPGDLVRRSREPRPVYIQGARPCPNPPGLRRRNPDRTVAAPGAASRVNYGPEVCQKLRI